MLIVSAIFILNLFKDFEVIICQNEQYLFIVLACLPALTFSAAYVHCTRANQIELFLKVSMLTGVLTSASIFASAFLGDIEFFVYSFSLVITFHSFVCFVSSRKYIGGVLRLTWNLTRRTLFDPPCLTTPANFKFSNQAILFSSVVK